MMQQFLWVGLGGAAGSMLRFAGQRWLPAQPFPLGTFAVNLAGCFLIGLLWGLLQKHSLALQGRLLLITGFCGGFTTFSAFSFESLQLALNERWTLFGLYAAGSVLGCLLATFIGFKLTH